MKKIPLVALLALALSGAGVFAQPDSVAAKPAPKIVSVEPSVRKLPGNHTLKINIKTNHDSQTQVSIVTSDGKIVSQFSEPGELDPISTTVDATIVANEQKNYDVSYSIHSSIAYKSGKDSIAYSTIGSRASVTLTLGEPVVVYQSARRTYTFEIIKTPAN